MKNTIDDATHEEWAEADKANHAASVRERSELRATQGVDAVATGSNLGCESGIKTASTVEKQLMNLEAEEHESIAQWLRGFYGSPILAAQHEAKAESIRRKMAAARP